MAQLMSVGPMMKNAANVRTPMQGCTGRRARCQESVAITPKCPTTMRCFSLTPHPRADVASARPCYTFDPNELDVACRTDGLISIAGHQQLVANQFSLGRCGFWVTTGGSCPGCQTSRERG